MGAPLDPVAFLSQPNTVLRILEFTFAIIVFGVIADSCFIEVPGSDGKHSVFNKSKSAANFGIAIGVLSFLVSLAWLVISFLNKTSSMFTQQRPLLAKLEVATDGFFTFMWFVAAIVLAAKWGQVNKDHRDQLKKLHDGKQAVSGANSAIVFAFFSWLAYTGSLFFSVPMMNGPYDDDYDYAGQADPIDTYQEFTEEEQADNQPVPF
eukprot:m.136139 g.136139  ORF g.136139 m.136139 type:complete len:207 (+) comp16022_c2_seq7:1634-2254(+)